LPFKGCDPLIETAEVGPDLDYVLGQDPYHSLELVQALLDAGKSGLDLDDLVFYLDDLVFIPTISSFIRRSQL
jgi:hypothetical protein